MAGQADQLLDQFKNAWGELETLGKELIKLYPQSELLMSWVEELGIATDSLKSLGDDFSAAIEDAELQDNLLRDLRHQMSIQEPYASLTKEEQDSIAHFMLENSQGLLTEDAFRVYTKEWLNEKDPDELVSVLSKRSILDRGKSVNPNLTQEFDQMEAGRRSYHQDFQDADTKADVIDELAETYYQAHSQDVVKDYYKKAFTKKELEKEKPKGDLPDDNKVDHEGAEAPKSSPVSPMGKKAPEPEKLTETPETQEGEQPEATELTPDTSKDASQPAGQENKSA